MDAETERQMAAAVLAASAEERGKTRLACADAFRIAAEFGVEPMAVARVCARKGIRIAKCQLGCFR